MTQTFAVYSTLLFLILQKKEVDANHRGYDKFFDNFLAFNALSGKDFVILQRIVFASGQVSCREIFL